jgi:predicted small lipoprotein YifL
MINLLRLSLAAALTLTIAACASAPPPPEADYAPPGKRQLDAKTQLETGRRY